MVVKTILQYLKINDVPPLAHRSLPVKPVTFVSSWQSSPHPTINTTTTTINQRCCRCAWTCLLAGMRSLSRFSSFCLCQVCWFPSEVWVFVPPNGGWMSACFVALVAKIPLICPAVPFLGNEKQQTSLLAPPYPVSLLCLLFLRRVFFPQGPKARPLLRFPSWSSALLIKKRCFFLVPCLGLGPAHSAAYA